MNLISQILSLTFMALFLKNIWIFTQISMEQGQFIKNAFEIITESKTDNKKYQKNSKIIILSLTNYQILYDKKFHITFKSQIKNKFSKETK